MANESDKIIPENIGNSELNNPREQLVSEALKYIGYNASNYYGPNHGLSIEEGFDCSGFVTFLLHIIKFPKNPDIRHSNEYFDQFGVYIHPGLQKKGDLIFISRDGLRPTHMGIMTDISHFIHSPGINGRVITIHQVEYKPIPRVENQIYLVNPIGFKRLALRDGRWKKIY